MSNTTDTNQASELFELCKKVYELTSWKDTHSRLDDGNHTIRNEGNEVLLGSKQAPLYTSDYLLEKLPSSLNDDEDEQKTYKGEVYYASRDAQQKRLYKEGRKVSIESYTSAIEFDKNMVQIEFDTTGTNYIHLVMEGR